MIRRLAFLVGDRGRVGRYVAVLLVSAVLRAVGAVAVIPLLTALFGTQPAASLPWLGVLVVANAAGWVIDRWVSRTGFGIGFTLLTSVEELVLDRLERIPLGWLTPARAVDARQALTSAGQELTQGIGYLLTPAANALAFPLLVGLGLLPIAWPLGIAMICAVPALLGSLWLSTRLSRAADSAYSAAADDAGSRIIELAQHQAALRASGSVVGQHSAIGGALQRQRRAAMRLSVFAVPGQLVFALAAQLALLALAGVTVVLSLQGMLTVPQVVALIVVIARFLEPFSTLADLAPALQALGSTVRRVSDLLDAPTLASPADSASSTSDAVLEFDSVTFGYDDDAVVDGVSFSVAPGTTTAIVGPSGSGKSTILALAARFHDADLGTVLVGGVPVQELSAESLRDRLSVVFQSVFLFDGTLRSNIALGDPDADESALAAAASAAGLDETIARLPDGWDARVGEAGAALSGGERQRVSIARALLKDSQLLLLDEATSALDTENEAAIVAALAASAPGRGTVIVAHRLATIAHADQVVFLEAGRVVEVGGPSELLAAGGRFAEFWHQRERSADWQLA